MNFLKTDSNVKSSLLAGVFLFSRVKDTEHHYTSIRLFFSWIGVFLFENLQTVATLSIEIHPL